MLVDLALQQKNYALALNQAGSPGKVGKGFQPRLSPGPGSGRVGPAGGGGTGLSPGIGSGPEYGGAAAGLPRPGRIGPQAPGLAAPPRPSRRLWTWSRTTRRCCGPWPKWLMTRRTMPPALTISSAPWPLQSYPRGSGISHQRPGISERLPGGDGPAYPVAGRGPNPRRTLSHL